MALAFRLEIVIFSERAPACGALRLLKRSLRRAGPARRASRKLLERVVEVRSSERFSQLVSDCFRCAQFIRLVGCEDRIVECALRLFELVCVSPLTRVDCADNQEQCRVNSYDGCSSLIRSFP